MTTPQGRKKLDAEQYLAEHRVRWLLEHITSELILLTPNEPLDFIIKRVEEISGRGAHLASSQIEIQRPRIICVLGGPASGKAVQCAFLSEESGMITVAPSELLRDEIKNGTEIGKRVGEMLHANVTVPTDIITELIKRKVTDTKASYVLDGYPRTMEQCFALEREVAEISLAIFLECSEATMCQRMDERVGTGTDDKEPHRTEKLNYWYLKTTPVVEYLAAVGKLVTVDAERPKCDSIRQVHNVVQQ